MSVIVIEMYEALKAAGAPDDKAKLAASAVAPKEEFATKFDIEKVKVEIIKWVAGMLVAQVAVGITLFKLLS